MSEHDSTCALPALPVVSGVTFRHIPSAPGYCVGDDGSYWTCRKRRGRKPSTMIEEWTRKAFGVGRGNYLLATLYSRGRKLSKPVHRLVLETFIGPPPEGCVCRHLNGNRQDNRLSNLRWGTPSENAEDRRMHGTMPMGERSAASKLSDSDVAAIKSYRGVKSAREVAIEFGITRSHVNSLWRGDSRSGSRERLKPGEENPIIECACGCGATLPKFNRYGNLRRYVSGHNRFRRLPEVEQMGEVHRREPAGKNKAVTWWPGGKQ